MHGDHDSSCRRSRSAGPRGRRPYGEPPDPSPEPVASPGRPPAQAAGRPYSPAGDPFVYGSLINVDIRTAWQPPRSPPSRWQRSWPGPRLARDRFLRPALICGFLAAAGVGIWSSGWSPAFGPFTVEAAGPPASPRTVGHDTTITLAEAATPSAGGTPSATPSTTSQKTSGSRKPASPRLIERSRADVAGVHGSQGGERRKDRGAAGAARKPAVDSVKPRRPKAPRPPQAPRGTRPRPPAPPGGNERRRSTDIPDTSAMPDTPAAPDSFGDQLSAAYACRHLQTTDWRYDYCLSIWNDYKRRNGLP